MSETSHWGPSEDVDVRSRNERQKIIKNETIQIDMQMASVGQMVVVFGAKST